MPLDGMSPEELEQRLVLLFNEMQRIRATLDAVSPAQSKAQQATDKKLEIFKSAFPRLNNPENS